MLLYRESHYAQLHSHLLGYHYAQIMLGIIYQGLTHLHMHTHTRTHPFSLSKVCLHTHAHTLSFAYVQHVYFPAPFMFWLSFLSPSLPVSPSPSPSPLPPFLPPPTVKCCYWPPGNLHQWFCHNAYPPPTEQGYWKICEFIP